MTSEIVRDAVSTIYCPFIADANESNEYVKFSSNKNFHESSFIIFVYFPQAIVSEFFDIIFFSRFAVTCLVCLVFSPIPSPCFHFFVVIVVVYVGIGIYRISKLCLLYPFQCYLWSIILAMVVQMPKKKEKCNHSVGKRESFCECVWARKNLSKFMEMILHIRIYMRGRKKETEREEGKEEERERESSVQYLSTAIYISHRFFFVVSYVPCLSLELYA